jgi:hypothetical protein
MLLSRQQNARKNRDIKIGDRCFENENENVRNIGQGEARHRKYKRLKLGGGQAYDRSSE